MRAYITKLSFRPYTLEHACRVRYYVSVVAQELIERHASDLGVSVSRFLLNCQPIYANYIDVEQPTLVRELNEINAALSEPILSIMSGAVAVMRDMTVLNITTHIHDHNQLVVSYEVYEK